MAADGNGQQSWYLPGNGCHKSCRAEGEAGKGGVIAFGGCRGRESSLWSLYTRPHPEGLQCKRVVCRDRRKVQLGSLWKNKHHIRKARTEHRQSREALALAREGVENAVQANYTNLLTSYTEVKTQQKQVELANQNYSVVQNRYQNDLALLTDMVDASNMKLSAEMALVNARISMLYNFYTLKYVTNTL